MTRKKRERRKKRDRPKRCPKCPHRLEKQYPEKALKDAVTAVNNKTMTIYRASKHYKVPSSTIHDHAKKKYRTTLKGGTGPLLTPEEENSLKNLINWCANRGWALNSRMLKEYVKAVVGRSRRKTAMKPSGPSDNWINKFMTKHNLSFKGGETVSQGKTKVSMAVLTDLHTKLRKFIVENGIEGCLDRIINADETGFSKETQKKKEKVISQVGKSRTIRRQYFDLEHTTAMIATTAAGETLPVFLIFKDTLPDHGDWLDGVPKSWRYGTSPTGFMNADLYTKWMDWMCSTVLKPKLRRGPMLLIIDNSSTHMPLMAIDIAREHGLGNQTLPANSSHIVQPNDKIYNHLKNKVSEVSMNFHWLTNQTISKRWFPKVLNHAIKAAFTKKVVLDAWEMSSLSPQNIDKIDKDYILIDGNRNVQFEEGLLNVTSCELF